MKVKSLIGLATPLLVFVFILYVEFLGVRHDHGAVAVVPIEKLASSQSPSPIIQKQDPPGDNGSLLGLLGVKPVIGVNVKELSDGVLRRIRNIGTSTAPVHLDSMSAPEGSAVHVNFSSVRCSEDAIGSSPESTVIQCVASCRAKPDCTYAAVNIEGLCSMHDSCSSVVQSSAFSTIYVVGDHIYPSDTLQLGGSVSHLWRMNKTNTGYHLRPGPEGFDLPPCIDRMFGEEYAKRQRTQNPIPELGVDQVYMVHYTKLVTRKKVITALHETQGVRSDWIEAFDHQNITTPMRDCIHVNWEKNAYKNPAKKARPVPSPFTSPGGFKGGELSVNTKHHYIYYDMMRNNYTFAIVLEDDAKLRSGFRRWFSKALKETPNDFDLFVFGGCLKMYGWRMSKQKSIPLTRHIYKKSMARCAHAYALTLGGAKKLLSSMPLTDVIDYQMNRAILETDMKVFWVEPWLAVQGPVGEAGQPRKTQTSGGDGEPYNSENLFKQNWIDTWEQGVPPQPVDVFKIPKTSSSPVCDKRSKKCWWL
eukprot:TRINITY_DN2541_c1_g1_i3.p1 TRINITY_DN2541_c1_g1~~TRINITY_DN2541_c1_g1_i3.p1  ORF type:complete len:532 (+),score=90.42 TRINITY_DN2541_c1_g1_i3:349-1944(+)